MEQQHVAIVTGAGGAIGRAIAVELARAKYHIVLVGRTQATLEQTRDAISSLPALEHLAVRADVSEVADVEHVVEATLSRFGRIDAIVSNAGSAPVKTISQTTPDLWRQVIDTNLSAAFYLARAVWPTFTSQRSGVIVNISSIAARDPFPGFLAYGAAKAALNNLGLSLAREGASIGVRVHTIAPGAVETPMFRAVLTPEQFPASRTLQPAEVARVVLQCVVGTELRYTSGEVIWLAKTP